MSKKLPCAVCAEITRRRSQDTPSCSPEHDALLTWIQRIAWVNSGTTPHGNHAAVIDGIYFEFSEESRILQRDPITHTYKGRYEHRFQGAYYVIRYTRGDMAGQVFTTTEFQHQQLVPSEFRDGRGLDDTAEYLARNRRQFIDWLESQR